MNAPPRNGVAAGELVTPTTADSKTSNAILQQCGDERKALANLKAAFALHAGAHAVHELADGGYLVVSTRWAGLCRQCPDFRALMQFARQIGVVRA